MCCGGLCLSYNFLYSVKINREPRPMLVLSWLDPATTIQGAVQYNIARDVWRSSTKDQGYIGCGDHLPLPESLFFKLNSRTLKDAYNLQRIGDTIDQLVGVRYLTKLDLTSTYWQVEIEDNDKEKCNILHWIWIDKRYNNFLTFDGEMYGRVEFERLFSILDNIWLPSWSSNDCFQKTRKLPSET